MVPEELYKRFLAHFGYEVPSGTRVTQADFILDHQRPAEVAAGFHYAAVVGAPNLDQIIAQIEAMPSASDREDAALWLSKHATDRQIIRMVRDSGHTELLEIKKRFGHRNPDAYGLIEVVTLSQLRGLWFLATFEAYDPTASRRKGPTAKPTHATVSQPEPSQVRRWARVHGHQIADRVRIPGSVMQSLKLRTVPQPKSPRLTAKLTATTPSSH